MRIAVIAGASGLIGESLLSYLLADEYYQKIIVLGRRSLGIKREKLEERIINFDQLVDVSPEGLEWADFYCCLGTTIKKAGSQEAFKKVDFTYPLELAQLAKKCNANQFLIVSAIGADKNSSFFYNRVKGEVQEAISNLELQTLHIFQPSQLLGKRKEVRVGEDVAKVFFSLFGFLFMGPLRKYKAIKGSTVAKAMYLKARQNLSGKYIFTSDKIENIVKECLG
ncbi:oxidoreductase [Xanthovirga aplysinae]|uniref:oxidoreductase n=1 Tax=Xanthovirga aplysinae TaxID=2529853 RepID=UPI0012BCECC8|nr:oxidoreductase [Xanthovirga aplysinae]MTI33372.1 oxidoreductase [Xanthovirga aplysinae]